MTTSQTITDGNLTPEDVDRLADIEEYANRWMKPVTDSSREDTAYRVSHKHANKKKSGSFNTLVKLDKS